MATLVNTAAHLLGQPARPAGVTIRGVAYRCGHDGGTARCEWPVGHDGPVMPRTRHVGRDDRGEWQVWNQS